MAKADKLLIRLNKHGQKYTLAVDFDGVLSNTLKGGYNVNDFTYDPVEGAVKWLWEMVEHFNVIIFTARELDTEGQANLKSWLDHWGFPSEQVGYSNVKPPSGHLYIDDRGYQFTGDNFPSVEYIYTYKPWNRK